MPCEQMIRIIDYTALNPTTRWEVACLSSRFPPHLWLSHASESAKSTGPARALDEDFRSGELWILQMCPRTSFTSHIVSCILHIVHCTFVCFTSWLVVGISYLQTQWPLKLVHPHERYCPFLPKTIKTLLPIYVATGGRVKVLSAV